VLVQLSGVSKSFGSQTILRDVNFQINPSEKIGLIGANGSGKTTLLKLIATQAEVDTGIVSRRNGLMVGALDQIPDFHETTTVFEEALRSFDRLISAENEMRALEHQIAESPEKHLLERYSTLQHEFEIKDGYRFRALTEAALLGVGFMKDKLNRPSRNLSGGEKNRLALAKLLLSEADLLLLDEPTNHLDIRSIEWLEKFLQETAKTVVVVSHDRIFLDRVVGRILEVAGCAVSDYRGNYTDYVRERGERLARQQKEWDLQQKWIAEQEDYIRRNIAGQKTKQAQSRRKLLARVHRLEKPKSASEQVQFRFLPVDRVSRYVLRVRHLSAGYDRPLLENVDLEVQRGERWAILGANGSGKTTLLRTLTGALAPLAGEMECSDGLEVGYYDQQLSDLDSTASVLDEIRELDAVATDGELRGYLGQFLFSGDDAHKKVSALSGGEKSRLALAKIIYEGPSLLALDEPTNHLDIVSREALEGALAQYPGTILFVTHDRYLAQKIATHLMYIEGGRAHSFDRLSAFEEWLGEKSLDEPVVSATPETPASQPVSAMSKNRREKIQREIAELEERITTTESALKSLEASFNNPDPQTDWEATHRKYAELQETLDSLYNDLAVRWELL
jgi:ATP-binding cassette, subfamily F, member 3